MQFDHLSASEIRKLRTDLAETLVEKERSEKLALVETIRSQIKESGYDLAEIMDLLARAITTEGAKYVNPSDRSQTWGGLGRRPFWLTDLEKAGHDKSEFLVR
ncbi:MAG: H-NS family nucleoid-associated regulatory protein [Microgenomates group bacterium]